MKQLYIKLVVIDIKLKFNNIMSTNHQSEGRGVQRKQGQKVFWSPRISCKYIRETSSAVECMEVW